MDYGSVFSLIVGFSASCFLCLPNLKKWQAKQYAERKLHVVNQALKLAEERLVMYQQRHDDLLSQITSHYLTTPVLEEALADSKDAMNEASKFVISLRKLQLDIITFF
ncbi:hypothetical protein POM88_036791 [Heracleum sosnowskyi]|uniref:Uncharacterized protein n=1 Tax=Heracleum sosnowskyi TaxID=360622 RepID=A0AAD8MFC0_9APIA|nr:hypothetical protein POM88_036791 [Heracleum sosnowskyi]